MKMSNYLGSSAVMVLALCAAAPAYAQSTDKPAGDTVAKPDEQIVVVGSRLRRTNFNSGAPITIISTSDKLDEGKTTATAVLQSNAITGGNAQINNAYSGYIVDGGPGTNTVGLRGLGATRTLILLNGRRLAPAGVQGGVSAVDLNTLPPSVVIDRYEILRDGASSIYGSDAVAGVINVVTKKKMGIELFGANSMTTTGAGSQQTLEAGFGFNSSRLSVVGAVSYYRQNALYASDVDWAQCQTDGFGLGQETMDPRTGQPKCYTITGTGSNGVTINTIGTTTRAGQGAVGTTATSFNRWRPNAAVTTGLVGWEGVGGTGTGLNVRDTFDPRMLQSQVISPTDLYRGFIAGSYDLQALGDAELYFSGLFSDRESSQQSFSQLSLDYAKGSPLIPASMASSTFLPVGGSLMNPTSATGVRAFIGYGQRGTQQSVRNYRIDGGIRGRTGIGDWRYDLYVATNRSEGKYYQEQFLTDRLAQSAYVVSNGSGGFNCVDTSRGCVAMPALTPAVVGGQLPANWLNFVKQWVGGYTTFDTNTVALSVDGTAFNLPYGAVKVASGAEYVSMKINDTPPADSITGNLYNYSTSAATRGSDESVSVYAEAEVPWLRNLPLAKDLTMNVSGRWTHYRSYGDGWTYKLNTMYSPVGWLTLRATYGTSFRAPSLKEQFQGSTAGFVSSANDPCNGYNASSTAILYNNCSAIGLPTDFLQTQSIRVNTLGGAAAGLKAETSDNLTLGAVFQPDLGRFGALKLSVDYYRITINNAVSRAGYGEILDRCYNDQNFGTPNAIYCRLVTRNPTTNALTVNDSYINVATQRAAGFDIQLRYTKDFGKAKLTLDGIASRYTSQLFQLFPDQDPTEYNGTVMYPKWTGQLSAKVETGPYSLYWMTSYVQGQNSNDLLGTAGTKYNFVTPDYFLHNASVKVKATSRFDIVLGVNNVFNKTPPFISAGYYNRVGNAPLYSGYDYFGRTVFMNVKARF